MSPLDHFGFFAEKKLVGDKENILLENVLKLQIDYVDSLIKREMPLKEISIGELFAKNTYIVNDLSRCRSMIEFNQGRESYKLAQEKDFRSIAINKINDLYAQNPNSWKEELYNFYTEERKKAGKYNSGRGNLFFRHLPQSIVEEGKEMRGFGIVNAVKEKKLQSFFEGSGLDIKDGDEGISIHFEAFWKNPFRNENPFASIDKAFQDIAKMIQKEKDYKNIKYIIGCSWLLSTPLCRNLGFKIFKEKSSSDSDDVWGQFTDKNGNFRENEARKLIETGKFQIHSSYGYITREDFLNKFNK
ncbi:MAG: hypothetical protein K9L98_01375 [Candidatus Pacebacteria bacterium]|nr:hypothetical protein [Candidatus Paceibacterota bacterium]MCF7862643.1 hypothetical protein [Candidatus Paceibacterota bacterium]